MTIESKGTLIEKYTRTGALLNKHIKCFVNPIFTRKPLNPHIYEILDNKSIHCENELLRDTPYYFETNTSPLHVPAYFAHYIHQAYEVYIQRKILLPRDDNGEFRIKLTENELHQRNNEIITLDMLKYNEQNMIMISVIKNSTSMNDQMINPIYNEDIEDSITNVEYTQEDCNVEIVPVEA